MVTDDIGRKVESGVTTGRDIANQVPQRSLATAQHLGNFALASAGLTAGAIGNTINRFKPNPTSNVSAPEPYQEGAPIQPKEEPVQSRPLEPEVESPIPPTQKLPSPITEEEVTTPLTNMNPSSPIVEEAERPQSEFEQLKGQRLTPLQKHKIQSLEKRLEVYKDPEAMFKAQGSNAFTRNYRKTMTRDQKLQVNIDRRDRLTQRLNELRGGIS